MTNRAHSHHSHHLDHLDRRARGALGSLVAVVVALALTGTLSGAFAADSDPHETDDSARELSAEQVIRRVNERPRGGDSFMTLRMVFHDAKRGDFVKRVVRIAKVGEDGYTTRFRMLEPEHEEGIGLLLSERAERRGMWMHFPVSGQTIRVASRGLSALASDFSCEDLLVELPMEEYDFTRLDAAEEKGHRYLRIEMVPTTQRLRDELGFARAIGWVREDLWMITRSEYFDRAGQLFKTFAVQAIEHPEGVATAMRYTMTNHRADHATEIEVIAVDYGLDLPSTLFATDALATAIPASGSGGSRR